MTEICARNWKSLHHSREMETISSTNISTGSFVVAFCWQLNLNLLWDIKWNIFVCILLKRSMILAVHIKTQKNQCKCKVCWGFL